MKNSRKHILALASWFPSRIFLDNGDFIQRHLRAISMLNDVTVVHAIKDKNLKSNFEIDDSINQNLREIIVYFKPSIFRPFNLIKQFQAFLKGVSLVNNFDIIHLNVVYPAGLVAFFLKKKYKKPIVLTEHWSGLQSENFKKLAFYKQQLIRYILRNVDIITPVSIYLKNEIKKLVLHKEFIIIPNVIDLELFEVLKVERESKVKFLHLSNLDDRVKNISGMLNVILKLSQAGYSFEFHFGGNGDASLISKFTEEHQLENIIKTFGRLEHSEVCEKMNEMNCFVLFSYYENQPCVQIEAFASGIPVIAKDVGGISEFLPEGFGILVNDETQLYLAMEEVINGKKFKSAFELNEYAKQHFSTIEIAKMFNNIYLKL
ncbi:glycosyltransferase [Empedobacter brevis]|uniref:glycosyltransferase n=1 Tax=Empedobacter brevis TaxID=247 RepID=UPI0039B02D9A